MSFASVKEKLFKYKEHLLTFAFIGGFVVDNFTLTRVDQLFDNALLLTYIVLAMVSLLCLYGASAGKFPERMNPNIRDFAPLITQYAYGSLFSGMLIFYGRSGSWLVSWPFLLIILAVIYGNETIRDRAQRLIFNVATLFVGLFLYVVLIVPVILGKMNAFVFVCSGVLALVIMLLFIRALALVVPKFIALHDRALTLVLGIIFMMFNFLYFANLIPPIPLSLKEVGIFHSVVRFENNSYQLSYEDGKWWQWYKDSDTTFHPSAGGSVFCFAKVFAPTKLETDIFHVWDYYDEDKKEWVEHAKLSYPIAGGADGGYRGYSLIQNYRDGKWRCTVESYRGQILGREVFTVDSTASAGELVTRRE